MNDKIEATERRVLLALRHLRVVQEILDELQQENSTGMASWYLYHAERMCRYLEEELEDAGDVIVEPEIVSLEELKEKE